MKMADMFISEVVKTGKLRNEWFGRNKVLILKQNWDFYFEEGYTKGLPCLNESGDAFYVIYDSFDDLTTANRSKTCLTLNEAIKLAEKMISFQIVWE